MDSSHERDETQRQTIDLWARRQEHSRGTCHIPYRESSDRVSFRLLEVLKHNLRRQRKDANGVEEFVQPLCTDMSEELVRAAEVQTEQRLCAVLLGGPP